MQRVAITLGDMNGIGPEVIVKAFIRSDIFGRCIPIVYGSHDALAFYHARLGAQYAMKRIQSPIEAEARVLNVLEISEQQFDASAIGTSTGDSGAASIAAIEAATRHNLSHDVDAMVTAPISKEAIAKAGSRFSGHTDMLAALTSSAHVLMILASNSMRVSLVTVHLPIKSICERLSREKVLETIVASHRALLDDFRIDHPSIAVLALNPHSGDGGVLGDEELTMIIPAIKEARAAGISADGPFASDGFFSAHQSQRYDMIVAMYHDQGLIPFKMQSRARGVNVTAGLPFVRTSPDHGTAFNIAGTLTADAAGMKEAILFALSLRKNRAH